MFLVLSWEQIFKLFVFESCHSCLVLMKTSTVWTAVENYLKQRLLYWQVETSLLKLHQCIQKQSGKHKKTRIFFSVIQSCMKPVSDSVVFHCQSTPCWLFSIQGSFDCKLMLSCFYEYLQIIEIESKGLQVIFTTIYLHSFKHKTKDF